VRHRRATFLGWLALFVVSAAAAGAAGSTFKSNFDLPSSDSKQALTLLRERFPGQAGDSATIVFHTDAGTVLTPPVPARMGAAFRRIGRLPHVRAVVSPYAPGPARTISPDGRTAFATVQFDQRALDLPKGAVVAVIAAAKAAARPGLQVELGGQSVQRAQQRNRQGASEGIALVAAIVVLLLTFGSVVAMGLPIVTALVALGTGLSLVAVATHLFDTSDFTPALAAMIGLGVGIDYALFIVTRFRSGLRDGLAVDEAVVHAMDTAGRAVLFAGATVVIALLGMFALGVRFLYGPAVAASLAVLLTMTAALTLLPAMLSRIGRRIDRWRVPGFGRARADSAGFWFRWSRLIQRRPWPAAILSAALLIVLAIRCSRFSWGRPTRAPTRPRPRRARPTTCWRPGSGPDSTVPCRSSRCCRRITTRRGWRCCAARWRGSRAWCGSRRRGSILRATRRWSSRTRARRRRPSRPKIWSTACAATSCRPSPPAPASTPT
jgi:RND superfamily putative drug exporter